MNEVDARHHAERIRKFNAAKQILAEVNECLRKIDEVKPDAPHGAGPFSGNARESRRIHSIDIRFTETRGGSKPVELYLNNLHIEACWLGDFLRQQLHERRKALQSEMEAI